jgi:hypothetical protein
MRVLWREQHQRARAELAAGAPRRQPLPLEAPTQSAHLFWRTIPTFEGVIWLGLAVFFISLRAFNLVTLIGSFMVGMLLLNWLRIALWGSLASLRIRRALPRGVYAGEGADVTLEIHNAGRRSQPALAVDEWGSCHHRRWSLPELPGGRSVALNFRIALPRRGRCYFGPLTIRSGYPFGLFRSWVRFDRLGETIVLPQLGDLHRGRLRQLLHTPAQPSSLPERHLHRRSAVPADFYGVREFRPGDSPRFIHWRTTARVGMPMVREFEETPLDNLVVVLEAWLPRPAAELYQRWANLREQHFQEQAALQQAGRLAGSLRDRDEALARDEAPIRRPLDLLEKAISLAATLCWNWQQNVGTQLALALADREARVPGLLTSSRGVLAHLESLAVLEGGPEPDLAGVVNQLARTDLPEGPVLVIAARPSPLADQLHAELRRPVSLLNVADAGVFEYFTTPARAVLL